METSHPEPDPKVFRDILRPFVPQTLGFRLLLWVIFLFLVTLVVFVGMDLRHESQVLRRLGISPDVIGDVQRETIILHGWHALVMIVVLGLGILVGIYRPFLQRLRRLLRAIHHFRLGIWRTKIPSDSLDEIHHLEVALRELGPHLERTFLTFVETDRKATVARLGVEYERVLEPLVRRLLSLSSTQATASQEWAWLETTQISMTILGELGRLGRPEHPAVAEIVQSSKTDETGSTDVSEGP